jgi:hypothetical protein
MIKNFIYKFRKKNFPKYFEKFFSFFNIVWNACKFFSSNYFFQLKKYSEEIYNILKMFNMNRNCRTEKKKKKKSNNENDVIYEAHKVI